jgi:hypothetical protein
MKKRVEDGTKELEEFRRRGRRTRMDDVSRWL